MNDGLLGLPGDDKKEESAIQENIESNISCDNNIEWNSCNKNYHWKTLCLTDNLELDPENNYDFAADQSSKEEIFQFIQNKLSLTMDEFTSLADVYVKDGKQKVNVTSQSSMVILISMLNQHICRCCVSLIRQREQNAVFCIKCMGYSHSTCLNKPREVETVDECKVCEFYKDSV